MCRSEINEAFSAGTENSRTAAITEVLRNLLQYGYLEKRLDQTRGRVYFWVSGKVDSRVSALLNEVAEPMAGHPSIYEDLYASPSAGINHEVAVLAEEQSGLNPVEKFLKQPNTKRSGYKADREQAILSFIEQHPTKRVGQVRLELKHYFPPFIVDRDIVALNTQGLLDSEGSDQGPIYVVKQADCNQQPADAILEAPLKPQHESFIIDPDYARIFTKARCIAQNSGYACLLNGSLTRELDLLLVPWQDHAYPPDKVLAHIVDVCDLLHPYRSVSKPHGRQAHTLRFKDERDPRFIDISVMPRL